MKYIEKTIDYYGYIVHWKQWNIADLFCMCGIYQFHSLETMKYYGHISWDIVNLFIGEYYGSIWYAMYWYISFKRNRIYGYILYEIGQYYSFKINGYYKTNLCWIYQFYIFKSMQYYGHALCQYYSLQPMGYYESIVYEMYEYYALKTMEYYGSIWYGI